jgi:hypothetical protein
MKTISAALKAHYAQGLTTIATCCHVTRVDGTNLYVTNHDKDIVFGGQTYLSIYGMASSNVETTDQMNPDNLEVQGFLLAPLITDADIHSGVWDYAAVSFFEVNYADLTMGSNPLRDGTLGELKGGRIQFTVELRGLMQAYTRNVVRLGNIDCDAALGDSRCKVAMGPFTVTGTVTGTNSTNNIIYDTGRSEAGPGTAKTISGITNANPASVHCVAHGFASGTTVQLSAIVGMVAPNTDTLNGRLFTITVVDADNFTIPVDTTLYSAYGSGGSAWNTSSSGYFDYGLITFTSGLNNGLSMEVKSYVPGSMNLQLGMPFTVTVGDTYSMTAGCNNAYTTCHDRFSNVVNFRGFPNIPGVSIYNVGGITAGTPTTTTTPVGP